MKHLPEYKGAGSSDVAKPHLFLLGIYLGRCEVTEGRNMVPALREHLV